MYDEQTTLTRPESWRSRRRAVRRIVVSSLLSAEGRRRRDSGCRSKFHGDLECLMPSLTLSVKHLPSDTEQPCAVCGARFASSEDSGSRVLSMKAPEQEPVI